MNCDIHSRSSQRIPMGMLLASLLFNPLVLKADVASYVDDFEAASINAFWATTVQNGAMILTNSPVHGGNQALQLIGSGGGQKEVHATHTFEKPQYGKVSVWVYDTQEYIYFGLAVIQSGVDSCTTGIGVQDWDHSAYYTGLPTCNGGKTAFPRSVGWHKFQIESTVSKLELSIDDQAVYTGAGGHPFNTIQLNVSGPGSGSITWDDFVFEAAPEPVSLQITSLSGNGQMTWTNTAGFSNALFTVEWASGLGTNWHSNWGGLEAFPGNGTINTAAVPMLFRVKAVTNLFIPWIPGAQLHFAVTNAVGSNWTEQIKVLGLVRPSAGAGKTYALIEDTEQGHMKTELLRSTDSTVYRLDANTLADEQEFLQAPVGTVWTNNNYEGQISLQVAVEAIETVTVPAGVFPNCYKYHKTALNAPPGETAEWYEWICPGFGMVKWLDYWVDTSEDPPVAHDLESWSVTTP